jgi:hypothetical protein
MLILVGERRDGDAGDVRLRERRGARRIRHHEVEHLADIAARASLKRRRRLVREEIAPEEEPADVRVARGRREIVDGLREEDDDAAVVVDVRWGTEVPSVHRIHQGVEGDTDGLILRRRVPTGGIARVGHDDRRIGDGDDPSGAEHRLRAPDVRIGIEIQEIADVRDAGNHVAKCAAAARIPAPLPCRGNEWRQLASLTVSKRELEAARRRQIRRERHRASSGQAAGHTSRQARRLVE